MSPDSEFSAIVIGLLVNEQLTIQKGLAAERRGDGMWNTAVYALLLLCTSHFYVSWASKEAEIFVLLTVSGGRNVG